MTENHYYINFNGNHIYILKPGMKIVEVSILNTQGGTYTRWNSYLSTESDISFIQLTKREIDRTEAASIIDRVIDGFAKMIEEHE